MGVYWTTPPTRKYLQSLKEEYISIKGNKNMVTAFHKRVHKWFFARYKCQNDELQEREPLPPGEEPGYTIYLNDAKWEAAREQSLRFWFVNNTRKEFKLRQGPQIKITLGSENSGSSRTLTSEQVYSKMYYGERVKQKADAEMERLGSTDKEKLSIRNRVTREKLEAESEEVKAEVEKKRLELEKEKAERAEVVKTLQDKTRGRLNFEELARVQKHIPQILAMFFDDLHSKTGWCFHVKGGGPQVDASNAPIKYTAYSVGHLDNKTDFQEWAKEEGVWKDYWKPFSTYTHKLFPEAERLRVAIHIDDALIEDIDALGESGRLPGKLRFDECPAEASSSGTRSAETQSGEGADVKSGEGASAKSGESAGAKSGGSTAGDNGGEAAISAVQATPDGSGQSANHDVIQGPIPGNTPKPRGRRSTKGKQAVSPEEVHGEGGSDAMNDRTPSGEAHTPVQNPFGAPPILAVWGDQAIVQSTGTNASNWDPNCTQGQSFLDTLFEGENPSCRSATGLDGAEIYGAGYGGGYDGGYGGYEGGYGGGYGSGYDGGSRYGGGGDFGIDLAAMNPQNSAESGMSEDLFALAGGNAGYGGGGTATGGFTYASLSMNTIPIPNTNLMHPNYQMGDRTNVGGGAATVDINEKNAGEVGALAVDNGNGMTENAAQEEFTGGEGEPNADEGDDGKPGGGGSAGRKRSLSNVEPNDEKGKRACTAKKQPEWIDQARRYLLALCDTPKWVDVVECWYEWEVRCSGLGGALNRTLPAAAARPPIVKKWVQSGCHWDVQDTMQQKDVEGFPGKWVSWWNAMQPKGRRSADNSMPPMLDEATRGSLGVLRKTGEKGFVLVLRALKLWAPPIGNEVEWQNAVEDVRSCITAMVSRG